jgi:multidrug resistance efflux pump
LSAEEAEIARLRAQLDKTERRLARTEVALDIMGKGAPRTLEVA